MAPVPRQTGATERAVDIVTLGVVAAIIRCVGTLVNVHITVRSCPSRLVTGRTTNDFVTQPATDTTTSVGAVLTPVTVNTFCNIVYIKQMLDHVHIHWCLTNKVMKLLSRRGIVIHFERVNKNAIVILCFSVLEDDKCRYYLQMSPIYLRHLCLILLLHGSLVGNWHDIFGCRPMSPCVIGWGSLKIDDGESLFSPLRTESKRLKIFVLSYNSWSCIGPSNQSKVSKTGSETDGGSTASITPCEH